MLSINRDPSTRDLRIFAAGLILFAALLAWLAHNSTDWDGLVSGFAALLAGTGILGCWKPAALRPVYIGWMTAVFPIGWIITHLLLALAWYGVVTPIALMLRIAGRDPLLRRPAPQQSSFWVDVAATQHDPEQFFRQS